MTFDKYMLQISLLLEEELNCVSTHASTFDAVFHPPDRRGSFNQASNFMNCEIQASDNYTHRIFFNKIFILQLWDFYKLSIFQQLQVF